MRRRPGVVGITGATGYVGSVLTTVFREAGWTPVALIRQPPKEPALQWRWFDLADVQPAPVQSLDALVHCAYDMRARTSAEIWARNVVPTRRLVEAASQAGCPVVVVSSMSAYEGTKQLYGRAKLAIEEFALRWEMAVVRPGLVYGPRPSGMFGTLHRLVRLPAVPVVHGHQFMVHEDDLARAVLAIVETNERPREPVSVAHPDPIEFRRLLEGLAALQGRRPVYIPVDWRALYYPMTWLERARLPLPLRADSLRGLAQPASQVVGQATLRSLGVAPRPFSIPVSAHRR